MTNFFELPHEKLLAYQEARKLLACVEGACIKDAKLRDQATEAARSACLNIAEGAGRSGSADKARVYAIARGNAVRRLGPWTWPCSRGCARKSQHRLALSTLGAPTLSFAV